MSGPPLAASPPRAGPAVRVTSDVAAGLLLIGAAGAALVIANSALAPRYFAVLRASLGPLSVSHWINDALMALFFLSVGLEIKRAFVGGALARWSDRILPVVAALAGMAVPALLYLAIAGGPGGLARGWAIPVATDIAFAVGIVALLGTRVPPAVRLLLVTIAVVDDLGAVLVIAVGYTATIDPAALAAAAGIVATMAALNRRGHRALSSYLLLGLLLWLLVHRSGVHATVAGVLTAFAIPGRGPLERLEHALAPWVGFVVMPLFGFANAGVALAGVGVATLAAPLPLAILTALFVGKQAGVFLSIRIAVAAGIARRPAGAGWRQIWGMSLLCGIGFTMSLFIGGLAFADPARQDLVRIAVLAGSSLSALAGYAVLRLSSARHAPGHTRSVPINPPT